MTHPRITELEALLEDDGVPMEDLKEAFILVNKEVCKHAELMEQMGAAEIGLVTAAARRIRNIKLETTENKKKSSTPKKSKAKTARGQINAILKDAQKDIDFEEEVSPTKDITTKWDDAF